MPPLPAVVAAAVLLAAAVAAAAAPGAVVRHARSLLVATALLALLAAAALVQLDPPGLRLRLDPSTEPLLPLGDPARDVYRQAVADFGDDEVYVIALETEAGVFRPEALRVLREVSERLARFPEVRRVQSLTDVTSFRYDAEGDWIDVGRFLEEIPEDPEALAALRAEALADPLYRRTLLSDDARTASINVSFRELSDRELIESRLDERVGEVLRAAARPGVRFHVSGRPHIKAVVYRTMVRDLRLLVPAALGVLALGLLAVFGTRRGLVLPLGVVVLATLWTFGTMAASGRPLTILSVLLAPTLVAIGSVYGVHALARYEEEAASAGSPADAALATLRHVRLPVCVAGATTAAGFGALLWTDVPAVSEVGAFAVLGVAALSLLTLTALPAALALLPLRPAAAGRGPSAALAARLEGALGALADAVGRRPGAVALAWLAVFALCAAAIPRIEIDTDYLSFFADDAPVRREFEAVDRLLAGAIPLYVTFRGDGGGSFREPEALRTVEAVQARARELPGVSHTVSLVDTVTLLNRRLARDDPDAERIPDTRGAVAELLFLAPKGELDRTTNVDHSRANLVVRTGAVGTKAVRELVARLEDAVRDAPRAAGVAAEVTGNAWLLARSADAIVRSQPRTVGLAALVILVLVAAAFRSLRLGAVAMVPNLVPVVIYFGLLGFGAAPLSLPTSLIGAVALGIAVDDTAHFLARYESERRRGLAPREAAAVCGRRVGRPMVLTSVLLMAGFGVIALSGFATLRQFGLLSAATMGVCLLTDLVLLPALLIRFRA